MFDVFIYVSYIKIDTQSLHLIMLTLTVSLFEAGIMLTQSLLQIIKKYQYLLN